MTDKAAKVPVTFRRHCAPFMPGDQSTLPADQAKILAAKGVVALDPAPDSVEKAASAVRK